jgi:hypothetical protein
MHHEFGPAWWVSASDPRYQHNVGHKVLRPTLRRLRRPIGAYPISVDVIGMYFKRVHLPGVHLLGGNLLGGQLNGRAPYGHTHLMGVDLSGRNCHPNTGVLWWPRMVPNVAKPFARTSNNEKPDIKYSCEGKKVSQDSLVFKCMSRYQHTYHSISSTGTSTTSSDIGHVLHVAPWPMLPIAPMLFKIICVGRQFVNSLLRTCSITFGMRQAAFFRLFSLQEIILVVVLSTPSFSSSSTALHSS